ncbi:MAG: stage III sporulation protein AD [Clostridia bacterium]|nr:stage III sporulation protein AD [Clostridia bacterium]
MDIVKVVAVGLITVIATIIVKQVKPEIAMLITLTGSIIIIILSIQMLQGVFGSFMSIFNKTGVSNSLFVPVLKIIGIGYLCEFSANLCVDGGCNSIADKILFCGKITILIIALPIINSVIDVVLELL